MGLSEDIVMQLLEEERKVRIKKVAETEQITAEDCLVIAVVGLNKEMATFRKEMATKDDIKNMATKDDIRRLEEDIRGLEVGMKELRDSVGLLRWLIVAGIAFLTLFISILRLVT